MEMQSASSSGNEPDYSRRGNLNARRPTVIYFYGILGKDGPKDLREDPELFFAKSNETKCHGMNSSVDILENKCGVDEEQENAQDKTCLKSSNNRLPKRQRTSFTQSQLERLEEEFRRDTYIVGMKRWRLSEELEVPEKQIKIWFQNRRTKSSKTKKGC